MYPIIIDEINRDRLGLDHSQTLVFDAIDQASALTLVTAEKFYGYVSQETYEAISANHKPEICTCHMKLRNPNRKWRFEQGDLALYVVAEEGRIAKVWAVRLEREGE